MADDTQRPSDLVPVSPSGYINTETTAGQQEQSNRPTDLVAVDPDYVANQVNPYNTVTGVASAAAAARPLIEKVAGSDATTRRSMEQYLRSQIHHDYPGLDLEALKKEMQTIYGPKSRIATYSEVQDALKAVKGQVPGQPAVDLTGYETVAKPTTMSGRANQGLKKVGEVIEDVSVPGGGFARQSFRAAGRGGLGFGAGYEGAEAYNKALEGDLGAAIPHASSALGYGALLATNPKIKGAGAVLAGLPLVGKYFAGNAQAAPMSREDVTGTGFDLATSLLGPASLALSPSQLGDSTLRKSSNERYRPGMSVLEGSRLPPELRAEGGLVYLAEGGAPKKSRASIAGTLNEVGTVQGPSLSTMARDYIAQLPATTEKNLRYQQDVMNRAMPVTMDNGRVNFAAGDPEAMREMTDMVSGMGGITKAVKGFVPKATDILKASQAFAPYEGKFLNVTQSDRMRSTQGDLGGPGFSKFQLEKPEYAAAQAAWGVGKKPTASGIVNVNKKFGDQAIWTPMIGGETQHHSNQHVYDMLANEFNRQSRMGNLSPELQAKINSSLATGKETKGLFPEYFDIGNPEHLAQFGDTFNRRGALSTLMSGKGVGGTKGRIIDYPGIMQEMTDPMTVGAPTHSLGTRLFSLNNEIEHRPDLHSAFPYILKGEDKGVAFAPVPKELGIQDFINQFKDFKGREPGYYDLVRTTPSQQITEKYLRSLEAAGHADGGSVAPDVSLDVRSIPSMTGTPGVGYMQTPAGAEMRLQMKKELELARLRAGVSGMTMAIPGQHGVKTMPGQMDIGANIPLGRGNLDISARRSINPIPGRGYDQGINAQYTLPFKKGGLV